MNAKELQKKITEGLLDNPTPLKLKVFSRILNQVIPFNAPHGFVFEQIDPTQSSLRLPKKRSNLNHLGGIHACAIATLGEYSAGVLLLKNFGLSDYRIILEKIAAEYISQGRTDLIGKAEFESDSLDSVQETLESDGVKSISLTTTIYDVNEKLIAKVYSHWQMKKWSLVRKPNAN